MRKKIQPARLDLIDVAVLFTCTVVFAGSVIAKDIDYTDAAPLQVAQSQTNDRTSDRPPGREPPFEQIAQDLDIPSDRVRDAFRKVGPPTRGNQPPGEKQLADHAQALATAMNVSVDKLRPVLEKYRPDPPAKR